MTPNIMNQFAIIPQDIQALQLVSAVAPVGTRTASGGIISPQKVYYAPVKKQTEPVLTSSIIQSFAQTGDFSDMDALNTPVIGGESDWTKIALLVVLGYFVFQKFVK